MSDESQLTDRDVHIDKSIAYMVYALYLIGYLAGGLISIVGLIIAYVARRGESKALLVSHHTWQIKIFWWSLLGYVGAFGVAALVFASAFVSNDTSLMWPGVLVMVALFVAVTICVIVVVCKGLLDLNRDIAK